MSLRVGLVCPYAWDVPGGVRSHVADLAVTLRGRGHSVNVLAPVEEESVLPDWVTDGGRPVAVPYNGSVARLSFGVKPPVAYGPGFERATSTSSTSTNPSLRAFRYSPAGRHEGHWWPRGTPRTIDHGSCRPGITSRKRPWRNFAAASP